MAFAARMRWDGAVGSCDDVSSPDMHGMILDDAAGGHVKSPGRTVADSESPTLLKTVGVRSLPTLRVAGPGGVRRHSTLARSHVIYLLRRVKALSRKGQGTSGLVGANGTARLASSRVIESPMRAACRRCGSRDSIDRLDGPCRRAARENRAMAVPMIVASAMWSRWATSRTGQPRSPDLQAHVGDDGCLGAQSLNAQVKLTSSIAPDVVYEFGITEHFGVASAPPGLTTRQPVVVPNPHRDAEHQAHGTPSRSRSAW